MAFKRLGAVDVSATTWTNLYTCPGSKHAIVSTILILNRNVTGGAEIKIAHQDNGLANEDYILYEEPLSAVRGNNHIAVQLGITMAAGDKLEVYSNVALVNFIAWGEEGDA